MASSGIRDFFDTLRDLDFHRNQAFRGAVVSVAAAVGAGALYMQWNMKRGRELKRPYVFRDLSTETVDDAEAEITQIITWLQDTLVRPLDARLPGQPFEFDLLSFPFVPLVMVVGNHSAGKSTFINSLLGITIQETGVAPTDDGFTVLQRHKTFNEVEDGPTLLGCPENRPFKELLRFGPAFWRHLRRKRLVLPKESVMPFGLQIVDTPGMIDMPVQTSGQRVAGGRGYNFLEVVRWFAQRADLILLLFDPDRPGTTGESLDVLTQSLSGLDHKFLILLNKVDQLDSSVDFARAYGTLGWALSKVIPRKDIPMIYTMYNAGTDGRDLQQSDKAHKLPLEAFRKKREEVIQEVLRTKNRHWDNVITSSEETLRQLSMVATVAGAVRQRVRRHLFEAQGAGGVVFGLPGVFAFWLLHCGGGGARRWSSAWLAPGFWSCYGLFCAGASWLLREHQRQFERLQLVNLDTYFEEAYASFFIHADAEDLRSRWSTVRPRTASILRAVPSITKLPEIAEWEITRINLCLEKDMWYLRQLAKQMRVQVPSVAPQAPPMTKTPTTKKP
eukprot:TRINITY_DN43757_c0_g1_i1.p1 TRINITY_DN43757_c0_g1~~TRINITY_DN43757_c0_g1_i1.p1  ORF type:complete len:559 (-),score=80.69 TRINITY_DN43757_c0_g1_i1:263-1939(-)